MQRYGLAQACDDIESLLSHVALAQGKTQKVKVLTGTGECSRGDLCLLGAGARLLGILELLQAPPTPSLPTALASRERQHDDAQLPGCCLRVPAGFPCGIAGQGDTGLRLFHEEEEAPAATWARDKGLAAPQGRACAHLGVELWCAIKEALPGQPLVLTLDCCK